jgi:hypothetical protein
MGQMFTCLTLSERNGNDFCSTLGASTNFNLYILKIKVKRRRQSCQRVYFHTKNPNLGFLFIEGLGMLILVYFRAIWYILGPSGIF